jgi:hypothetical protein
MNFFPENYFAPISAFFLLVSIVQKFALKRVVTENEWGNF